MGTETFFLNDDLTTLRSKLVYELKRDETIKSVWTIDGRIMCVQEEGGKDVKRMIESPDDLFKVGGQRRESLDWAFTAPSKLTCKDKVKW